MLENLKNYKVVLASASPRRYELLSGLDVPFEVRLLPDIDESYPANLREGDVAGYIARKKAEAYHPTIKNDELIITADTIVWLEDRVLGKPSCQQQAMEMIKTLSGKTHQVFTGVAITTVGEVRSFVACSNVTFASITEEEIEYYVKKYMPMDKAGSYGAQEWIGYIGMEHIEGSYFNVMGLPVQKLYSELRKINPI